MVIAVFPDLTDRKRCIKKIRRNIFETIEDKYRFIDANCSEISVDKLCRLLEISRSGYYAVSPKILNRDFTADKPNQKWVGDITYIHTDEGWLYAAIVKDLCLKKIVGYSFSSRIDTNLTVTALKMAVNRQKPQDNLIFYSERGVQYASAGYREALAEYNITQSMSRFFHIEHSPIL